MDPDKGVASAFLYLFAVLFFLIGIASFDVILLFGGMVVAGLLIAAAERIRYPGRASAHLFWALFAAAAALLLAFAAFGMWECVVSATVSNSPSRGVVRRAESSCTNFIGITVHGLDPPEWEAALAALVVAIAAGVVVWLWVRRHSARAGAG